MQPFEDVDALRTLLPGTWVVKATNFPMWLTGERRDPTFSYEVSKDSPLTLTDTVAYVDADGKQKTIVGTDKWRGSGFVWRGKGLLGFASSKWQVAAAEENIAAIRFEKSIATPAGVDIIVREGTDDGTLRKFVASDPARLGLTLEDFASLTWLDHVPPVE